MKLSETLGSNGAVIMLALSKRDKLCPNRSWRCPASSELHFDPLGLLHMSLATFHSSCIQQQRVKCKLHQMARLRQRDTETHKLRCSRILGLISKQIVHLHWTLLSTRTRCPCPHGANADSDYGTFNLRQRLAESRRSPRISGCFPYWRAGGQHTVSAVRQSGLCALRGIFPLRCPYIFSFGLKVYF